MMLLNEGNDIGAKDMAVDYAVRFAWDFNFFMCTKMVCLRLGKCH